MKNGIKIIIVLGLLSATPINQYVLTPGEAAINFNLLNVTKKLASESKTISAYDATQIALAADSIQKVLIRQNVDTTKSK